MALRSSLFTVQAIEIEERSGEGPIDSDAIATLAAVPVGRQNLFDLELDGVEARLRSSEWIRDVAIRKRFPRTVSISVSFKEPRALIQLEDGALAYIDSEGKAFGRADPRLGLDLPLVSGRRVFDALGILEAWSRSPLAKEVQLAEIRDDPERGFRALAVYPIGELGKARVPVELGPGATEGLEPIIGRLDKVFRYLIEHRLVARRIRADAGKKVIVRIARSS